MLATAMYVWVENSGVTCIHQNLLTWLQAFRVLNLAETIEVVNSILATYWKPIGSM